MEAKLVIANVPSDKLEVVEKRLERLGVEGLNVCKVKGFGEYHNFFGPNWLSEEVRIEVFTKAINVAAIVSAIMECAHTGGSSDGFIAVVPIENVFLIRTRCEATPESFWPRAKG